MPDHPPGAIEAMQRTRERDAFERQFWTDVHAIAESLDTICAAVVLMAAQRGAVNLADLTPRADTRPNDTDPGQFGAGHD